MTTENKVIAGVGGLLLLVGGIVFWNKRKANNEIENVDSQLYLDQPTNEPVKIPASTTTKALVTTKPVITKVIQDGFSYRIGQEIMANVRPNVPAQDVQLNANGEYYTNGENIGRFPYGSKIGKIKEVLRRPDGTYRYVVARSEFFGEKLYWLDHKNVKPIGVVVPPSPTVRSTAGLDMNLTLHRGLYNSKEVEELQKRLKLKVDGDFGPNTENALFVVKKVKEIKLKDF